MKITITEIYDLLYSMGLTANHTYFFHTAYAVWLCTEQQERLQLVTKWLYPEVAKQYKTTWTAVERNIRRAIGEVWGNHRSRLEEIAGTVMETKPRPAQFLGILTASVLKGRAA